MADKQIWVDFDNKTTLVANDALTIADSAAGNATKDTTVGAIQEFVEASANTFTGVQIFEENAIWRDAVFSQGASVWTSAWANECAFKSQNTSSWAIWSVRTDASNNLSFEYYNGVSWSVVTTLNSAWTWT